MFAPFWHVERAYGRKMGTLLKSLKDYLIRVSHCELRGPSRWVPEIIMECMCVKKTMWFIFFIIWRQQLNLIYETFSSASHWDLLADEREQANWM